MHLGGTSKPDGILYTNCLKEDFGVIIDTKAYSKGYSLSASEADKMERYIGENQTRDEKINSNKWWRNFSDNLTNYYFMFISSYFTGGFEERLKRISRNKGILGTAISIENLLLYANNFKKGEISYLETAEKVFCNKEYIV